MIPKFSQSDWNIVFIFILAYLLLNVTVWLSLPSFYDTRWRSPVKCFSRWHNKQTCWLCLDTIFHPERQVGSCQYQFSEVLAIRYNPTRNQTPALLLPLRRWMLWAVAQFEDKIQSLGSMLVLFVMGELIFSIVWVWIPIRSKKLLYIEMIVKYLQLFFLIKKFESGSGLNPKLVIVWSWICIRI